ncbi:unnamed protein product [Soboliphyme baturini]|uniref:Mucin 1, cell surface associated n=1 Tax=Soboliphyme baturini TaxID=241478 RepID=A0A183J213_9BILA|nr:unnamed protein product [Soboliphyme baturini]
MVNDFIVKKQGYQQELLAGLFTTNTPSFGGMQAPVDVQEFPTPQQGLVLDLMEKQTQPTDQTLNFPPSESDAQQSGVPILLQKTTVAMTPDSKLPAGFSLNFQHFYTGPISETKLEHPTYTVPEPHPVTPDWTDGKPSRQHFAVPVTPYPKKIYPFPVPFLSPPTGVNRAYAVGYNFTLPSLGAADQEDQATLPLGIITALPRWTNAPPYKAPVPKPNVLTAPVESPKEFVDGSTILVEQPSTKERGEERHEENTKKFGDVSFSDFLENDSTGPTTSMSVGAKAVLASCLSIVVLVIATALVLLYVVKRRNASHGAQSIDDSIPYGFSKSQNLAFSSPDYGSSMYFEQAPSPDEGNTGAAPYIPHPLKWTYTPTYAAPTRYH